MKKRLLKLKQQSEIKSIGLILCIMLIQAIRYFPFKFGGWNQIQLSLNYSYGFVQRAFLGTVLDVCSSLFHIPWKYMRYIYGVGTMGSFSLLMLWILYKALTMSADDRIKKNFFYGLGLVFFIGPGWSTNYNNFALTDLWLPLLSILGMYVVIKGKNLYVAFIVSVICILIHPAYVFMYYNLVLGAFAYRIFILDKTYNKRNIVYGIITFIFCCILFVYMMFFSHAKEGVTIEHVMERTAEFVSKSVEEIQHHAVTISGYLFREGPTTGIQLVIQSYWLIFLVMLVMFSPFIYEVYRYWKHVIAYARTTNCRNWWIYVLAPLGIVTVIPMYIMHNDYGRWTYAVFFYEFAIIWLLNMVKDVNAEYATREYMKKVLSNKWYYIVLLFYAGISGPFEQNLVNSLISTIESYGWKLINLFM